MLADAVADAYLDRFVQLRSERHRIARRKFPLGFRPFGIR